MKTKLVIITITMLVLGVSGDAEGFPTEQIARVISDLQETFNAGCLVFTTETISTLEHERKIMQCGKMISKNDGKMLSLQVKSHDKIESDRFQCRKNRPLVVILDLKQPPQSLNQVTSYPRWVLFTNTSIHVDELMKLVYVPFDCEFLIAEKQGHEVYLTEVYRVKEGGPLVKASYGHWSDQLGLVVTSLPLYERRNNLHGVTIQAAVVDDPPVISVQRVSKNSDEIKIGMFLGELWGVLERRLNFLTKFSQPADGSFGTKLANGSFTGIVAMVNNKVVDVGIGDFTYMTNRYDALDYMIPTLYASYQLIILQPETENVEWGDFFAPFEYNLWLTFIASALVIAMTLTVSYKVVGRCGHDDGRRSYCHFADSIFHVYGVYCQQGQHETPTSLASRIAYLTACMTSIVLLGSYSAALISSLASQVIELPFEGLQGFTEDGTYELGVLGSIGPNVLELFEKKSNRELHGNQMNKFFDTSKEPAYPLYDHNSLHRICTEKFAFLSTTLYSLQHLERLPCSIKWLPDILLKDSLSLVTVKGSPYTRLFNHQLRLLEDSGVLDRLRQHYWPASDSGYQTTVIAVGIQQTVPILVVLTSGIALACLALCCERAKRNRPNPNPFKLRRRVQARKLCRALRNKRGPPHLGNFLD